MACQHDCVMCGQDMATTNWRPWRCVQKLHSWIASQETQSHTWEKSEGLTMTSKSFPKCNANQPTLTNNHAPTMSTCHTGHTCEIMFGCEDAYSITHDQQHHQVITKLDIQHPKMEEVKPQVMSGGCNVVGMRRMGVTCEVKHPGRPLRLYMFDI